MTLIIYCHYYYFNYYYLCHITVTISIMLLKQTKLKPVQMATASYKVASFKAILEMIIIPFPSCSPFLGSRVVSAESSTTKVSGK